MRRDYFWPGTKLCNICFAPTGQPGLHCTGCERMLVFIDEAHIRGGDRDQTELPPEDRRAREERIRQYQRRAARGEPLFQGHEGDERCSC